LQRIVEQKEVGRVVHDRGREILEAEASDELSKLDGERARGGGHRGQYGTTSRAR